MLAFLADEAATATAFAPAHTEAAFGFDDSEKGPLPLAGGGVHGQIDRIDLGPRGEALVQDYKSGGKVDGGAGMLEKRGKLQLQLYMLAARELWGHRARRRRLPARSAAPATAPPRACCERSWPRSSPGLDPRPRDHLDDEEFEGALEAAKQKAEEIVASVQARQGDPRPDRGQLPRLVQLPADLPPRARAAGGGALLRGGRGGMSAERTEQQGAAVESRGRDVFLRAGAGTGKTTVLVDRFCAAALDPEGGVERILAFTFTERAADQLRRRVREELAARVRGAEGEQLEALAEALEAIDRAWISTIHGFCRRVLASHPAAAGHRPPLPGGGRGGGGAARR